jgi:hypothetical protein
MFVGRDWPGGLKQVSFKSYLFVVYLSQFVLLLGSRSGKTAVLREQKSFACRIGKAIQEARVRVRVVLSHCNYYRFLSLCSFIINEMELYHKFHKYRFGFFRYR